MRKRQMSASLYQLLQHPDTVPLEFQSLRNIINRFVDANDGYAVLYTIMEPYLHKDEVCEAPDMSECHNIHEYAKQMTSYFHCENLAGRTYNQKEKANLFLKGLDARYSKQVARAKQLFDGKDRKVTTVPDVLLPEAIPDTIERWLNETNKQSVIRAMFGKKGDPSPPTKDTGSKQGFYKGGDSKRTADKPCGVCQIGGHHKSECSGFAKYILFKDADKAMDDIGRSKIVEKYRAHLKEKADARAKLQSLGNVRHMWESGQSYNEIEKNIVQMVMSDLQYDPNDSSDDESSE
mmetsp:Transcript_21327/g.30490  ORF Transcript_21327/g.30490 Transcript_21327/m.30490 type:complete len:292 (+) Transcript_21327:1493-2368(+)